MTESERKPTPADEPKVCLQCGVTSATRIVIPCHFQGQQKWVCVSCLPILIHGAH